MLIIALSIITLAISGTMLMADWTGNTIDVYINGNVSIGTTSPGGKLVVQGIYPQLILNSFIAGTGSLMYVQDVGNTAGVIGHLNTNDRL